jgi:hypothetical protein
MTVETRLPASSAGQSVPRSFGSASVRLLAPQLVFETIRAHTAGRPQGAGVEVRWPAAPPPAANQNEPPRSSAA